MQLPPLPLANFSIHSLEQRFGRAFLFGFCFFCFLFLLLENGKLLSGQQPTGSAVGRNARDVLGTSAKSMLPQCLSIRGTFGLFWNQRRSHFQPFHILSYILEGTVKSCKPVFHWESLTDIPSPPPPLLAKEQASHRRFIAWPSMKASAQRIVGDTPRAS